MVATPKRKRAKKENDVEFGAGEDMGLEDENEASIKGEELAEENSGT